MRLFTCPRVPSKLRITKKACAYYYKIANEYSRYRRSELESSVHHYCVGCKIGKKNSKYYHGKLNIQKPKKVCKLYDIDPESCINEKSKGIFYKEKRHSDYDWNAKQFCSHTCAITYNTLKAKGRIK